MRVLAFASLLILGSVSASASPVTLTFTGLKDLEPISNYYNGGTGGSGSTGGQNYGISFTSDSLAIVSMDNGGSGNFNMVPPPASTTVAFFLTGAGDIMNVAAGFTTGFAFYYTSPYYAGTVNVYSGLNGTGTLLASDLLGQTPAYCNGSIYAYSCWVNNGVAFAGSAESVVFSGVANQVGFADITPGATLVPLSTAPEPGSLALLSSGVLGLAAALRSSRRHSQRHDPEHPTGC